MASDTVFEQIDEFCSLGTYSRTKDWFSDSALELNWETTSLPPSLTRRGSIDISGVVVGEIIRTTDVDASDLEIQFLGHATKWERDTRHLSSMTDIMRHPSYQWVLETGKKQRKDMLRLLLLDLRDNERRWFTALAILASTNPVDPKDAGRVGKMAKAWINWGKREGLL